MTHVPHISISARFTRREGSALVSQNERSILRLIWRNPGISRSDVKEHLDLTQQSVYRIIDQLTERGILQLGDPAPGRGRGQPSPTLQLNGNFAFSCGISLDADAIGLCLMDLSGKLLAEDTIALVGQSMDQALKETSLKVSNLMIRCGLSEEGFLGVGFAIAGFYVGGTRYNAPLPLHEWSLIELGPLLNAAFSKPIWIYNVSQTAAVAESMIGIGRHVRDFAYLYMSHGFGGALISNNELLPGSHMNAGEFANILHPTEVARRPALKYLISKLEANGIRITSLGHFNRAFDREWPEVEEWVNKTAPAYNRVVNAICAVFDPQAIVFGGAVPRELAQMLIEKTEFFELPRYGVPHPPPKIVASEIGGNAAAIGAAVVPFKELIF